MISRQSFYRMWFVSISLAILGLALQVAPAWACGGGVICVDGTASSTAPDGLSWTTAYTNVQDALDVATSGDEIWVAEGVYYPDEGLGQVGDDRTSTFDIVSGAALYGGFPTGGGTFDARDWEMYVTVLSGDLDQNDIVDDAGVITDTANITGTNTYNVVTAREVSNTTTLDGFTITGGCADGSACPGNRCGGGMLNYSQFGPDSMPTVRHVVFSGNYADGDGGGMLNWSGDSATMIGVTFVGNRSDADGGGLMAHSGSDVHLTDVVFERNTASGGGGMSAEGSSPVLTNTSFVSNTATYWGGGFRNAPSVSDPAGSPRLINVLFSGNVAGSGGGGMYNWGVSTPTLTNVTFGGNIANGTLGHMGGGGLYNYQGSTPILVNSVLWGNVATGGHGHQLLNTNSSGSTLSYTLIQSGTNDIYNYDVGSDVIFGLNILTEDPRFVDPGVGDYRLGFGSPAIDAGDDGAVIASTDLDGNPRRLSAAVDLGAYEAAFPDLALEKSVAPALIMPHHDIVTYTLSLSNTGAVSDTVILTDTLPDRVAFGGWVDEPEGVIQHSNAITWTGTVTAGERVTLVFTATHTGEYGDVIANTAAVSGTIQRTSDDGIFTIANPFYLPLLMKSVP